MTATAAAHPTAPPRQRRRPRRADAAFRVFAVAVAVGLVHALDDAVFNRQPGVPVDQHLSALAAVATACVLAIVAFRRLRTGLRAVLSLTVGAITLTNGTMHLIHIVESEVSGSDVSGVMAALAGAALVLLAAALPFLHRGERNLPATPRWAVRGLAAVSTLALIFTVLMPIGVGIGQTHLFRVPIGESPDDRYAEVAFESADGLRLSGWYAPSRNGAAVVLVNSAGGDRLGSVQHAQLLAEHGYGVLLYDARGTGDSEGSPNGYGWNWDRDVDGAIEFLQRQPDVDPERIGGLGLSTGGDVLIEVAAHNPHLRAVVSDGATIRSFADIPADQRGASAHMFPVLLTVMLLSGSQPGAPLVDLAAQTAPTPMLLIAAGSIPQEIRVNEEYARAAGASAELWALPDVRHTAAIRAEADAYERRVVGHFERALL